MIKIENVDIYGWEAAIRGMRNPKNSWDKSDSKMINAVLRAKEISPGVSESYYTPCEPYFKVGPNDYKLMKTLADAGPVHGKYRRMITVTVDITAPFYWWKEFDTYKVGTVANSCSTMHKLAAKEFEIEDFSYERLGYADDFENLNLESPMVQYYFPCGPEVIIENGVRYVRNQTQNKVDSPRTLMNMTVNMLNKCRELYLKTNDKRYWEQMIQLLPSSYNQKRTVQLNYEVLSNIYEYRKDHKLSEWREFCKWIETLPYYQLITGEKTMDLNSSKE